MIPKGGLISRLIEPPAQFARRKWWEIITFPRTGKADCRRVIAMFENIRSDFEAHGRTVGAQGFWVMIVYRFGRWRYSVRPALLRKLCSFVYKVLYKIIQILTGIELPCEAIVGRNFVIDHFGGIIVSGYARFGDNCRIRNGVVVGLRRVDQPVAPVIGNNVDIGSGAKLLGPITIGDNSLIGANAVVLIDVPPNSIAIGVPATIRPRSIEPGNDALC
ncbi:serine O-acetyltransferase [Bradyrhizobium paxllaeri]|uniref:serine O-acetyltransferase n=1 Tax=Bradyrhizobium paxllaeri TaxID=190148 RepID=UPI001FE40D8F|nr:DapH/DapD/GlmU-related protein [Bradyrhizobium paxllaeri]